jgi:hypothetical protein
MATQRVELIGEKARLVRVPMLLPEALWLRVRRLAERQRSLANGRASVAAVLRRAVETFTEQNERG